jgi:DNA-binding GntR family transcriptional regulator
MARDELETNLDLLKLIGERKSLGQHVFETLRMNIIRGSLPAGSRVVESRTADELGISRTPVREALHKLEREGLLARQPRGGYVVLGLSRDDIEETFGIRSILESYAARLAALKHSAVELEPLEQKITVYQAHLDRGDFAALPKINTAFHDQLYALSRSPKLIHMINGLRDHIFRYRQIILQKEQMARQSNADHQLMLDAIKQRDGDSVERLVREHILRGQKVVLEEFDRQQAAGTSKRPPV